MAEMVKLEAQPRQPHGSQAARRLRRQGLIPAIIYGHKEANVAVSLPAADVERALRHGVHVVDLKAGDKSETALIKAAQWDHLGQHLIHVDFARVSADERVTVTVPLELRGTAPGVTHGGLLDQPLHSLAVECPVLNVPESIRVPVGELEVGQAIHVKDLVLPPNVTTKADPDAIVVHVVAKAAEPAAAAAPVAEVPGAAEPEVIGRQAKAAEEEGE